MTALAGYLITVAELSAGRVRVGASLENTVKTEVLASDRPPVSLEVYATDWMVRLTPGHHAHKNLRLSGQVDIAGTAEGAVKQGLTKHKAK